MSEREGRETNEKREAVVKTSDANGQRDITIYKTGVNRHGETLWASKDGLIFVKKPMGFVEIGGADEAVGEWQGAWPNRFDAEDPAFRRAAREARGK
jgi:hypothetical protein